MEHGSLQNRSASVSIRGILQEKPVPPAVFIRNLLITSENVDNIYPNDQFLTDEEVDNLLLVHARNLSSPKRKA
jgi:hypothetical protein